MRWKLTATALALLAALSSTAFVSSTEASCPVCRRTECQQLCGPQQPAFCDVDPYTGCPFCACNG